MRFSKLPTAALLLVAALAAYYLSVFISIMPRTNLLWHDNVMYHMPNFIYVLDSLRFGYGLPLWYPETGGSPLDITSISLFPFVPYRIVAYALGLISNLHEAQVYKISLAMGVTLAALGWWLALRQWLASTWAAAAGVMVFLFGGTGLTVFHQEQTLVTVLMMPWVVYALIKTRDDASYLMLAAALSGMSLTLHYPHIQLMSTVFFVVALWLTGALEGRIKPLVTRRKIMLVSAVLFVLALLPLYPVATTMGEFSSPLRVGSGIGAKNLTEYISLNGIQYSSSRWVYLLNYLLPSRTERLYIDMYAMFIPYAGLALAAAGCFMGFRRARVALIMLVLGLWATLGIHAYLPQILFVLHVPFIGEFRQWYHFVPVVNLALSALAALGANELIARYSGHAGWRLWASAALAIIALEGGIYMHQYSTSTLSHVLKPPKTITRELYTQYLSHGRFAKRLGDDALGLMRELNKPMVTYRSIMDLSLTCPKLQYEGNVFVTKLVYQERAKPGGLELQSMFCATGLQSVSVLAKPSGAPISGVETLPAEAFDKADPDELASTYGVEGARILLTPVDAVVRGESATDGLLVVPFAYDMGFDVTSDARRVSPWPVYMGAMVGVPVKAGPMDVTLSVRPRAYPLLVAVQYATIFAAALLAIFLPRTSLPSRQTRP